MSKKIKIMHIINNLEVGGAEKMLILLLNELSKMQGVELYLVSLEGHGPLIKQVPSGVILKNFKYKLFGKFSRFDPNVRVGLLSYVKKIKPDIIHGHLFRGEDMAKTVGLLTKTLVITTSHDTIIYPNKKTRLFNKYFAKAVAVSGVVAEHLTNFYKIPKDKITIIPNAIDTEAFYEGEKKFNKDKPIFIYIGRILKLKGIDDAINGIAKLRKDYPKLEFLIYGKEVHRRDIGELKKLVAEKKYDFVKFMGRTDNAPEALSSGDIFVLPSRSEGFAISVLEAAAAKKPVVATRVGAIPEIVKDGVSGILVDVDSPNQIYEACKKILDESLIERFGDEARKIAESRFDKTMVAKAYMNLYKKVINN